MNERKKILFISYIRAFAALAVVWDHLVGLWLDLNHHPWFPLNMTRKYITEPLGIIQDFGFLAVVLFFFVSGFIITHSAQRETRGSFLIRRIIRIYPALIVSVFIIYFSYELAELLTKTPNYLSHNNIADAFFNSLLINFLFKNQNIISGVTWTLIIEMLFYFQTTILHPLVKNSPVKAVLIQTTVSLLVVYFSQSVNIYFLHFASIISFVPFLLLGQLLYYKWSNQMSFGHFIMLTTGNFVIIITGIIKIRSEFMDVKNSYPISLLLGYLIFVLLLLLEKNLKKNKIIDFFSNISYSLYLNHYMLGMLLISTLVTYAHLPYTAALGLTLCFVTIVSILSFKFIEEPCNYWIKSITKKKKFESKINIIPQNY